MIDQHAGKKRLGGIGKPSSLPYSSTPKLSVTPEVRRDVDAREVFEIED